MNKRIVIIPVFCDTHFIKYQIPNIIDTINPDVIIYNEGMFPVGPESCTAVNDKFLKKYTLNGGGKRGFDYLELKQKLISSGYKFETTSDTEVIIKLFHKYGKESFKMLSGIFAISIYDRLEEKLYLIRDIVGVKIIYYYLAKQYKL